MQSHKHITQTLILIHYKNDGNNQPTWLLITDYYRPYINTLKNDGNNQPTDTWIIINH